MRSRSPQSVQQKKSKSSLLASGVFNLKPAEQQLEPRDIERTNTEYVPFGLNGENLFPQELAIKFRRSSSHHAIIKAKTNYFVGDGWIFEKENSQLAKYIQVINSEKESLLQVAYRVAQDFFVCGNAYIMVSRNKGALALSHLDFTTVRRSKAKEGEPGGFYVSKEWEKGRVAKKKFFPEFVPGSSEKASIYHIKEYSPNMFFYGLPDYLAALSWIDIEFRIPKYNIGKFKNDFTVSAVMDMYATGMSEEEAQDKVAEIKSHFTNKEDDSENNSKLWVNVYEDGNSKTVLTKLNDGNEGNFMQLQTLAVQNIITAHRITPSLCGVKTAGSIGSNQQIRNEFEIFYNTVIKPVQNKILSCFDYILSELGFDEKLAISTPVPISFMTDIQISSVLTINEQRKILGFKEIEGGGTLATQKQTVTAPKE